jgi:membrane-associated phospholipid phosphatase
VSRPAGRRWLLVIAAASLLLFGMLLLAVTQGWGPLHSFDTWCTARLHQVAITHSGWVFVMRVVSDAGSFYAYVVVFGPVVALLILLRRWPQALVLVLTVLGSSQLNQLVKAAVARPRPTLPTPVYTAPGLSFPSGHAQSAVVGWTLLAWLLMRRLPCRWRWLPLLTAAVAILAIGFSRVALGVHYPSDVLAGFALGGAWVASALALILVLDDQGDATNLRGDRPIRAVSTARASPLHFRRRTRPR